MSSHRVRKRQAAYSKMSKQPGLVSTLGRSMFIRKVIRRRTNCGKGCNPEILGILVAVLVNNSPIEIPLTFTEPITVDWDDENNRGKVTYQPGDRVFHNYQKRDAGGNLVDADPRERTITVTYKNNVEFDYSEDQGSYLQTHAAEIEDDAKYTFNPKVGDNLTGKDGTQYYIATRPTNDGEFKLSTSSFPIKKVVDAAFEFNADSNIKQGNGTAGLDTGDKIFDTAAGADAIDFGNASALGAGAKNLWVYTTRNNKKDGILHDKPAAPAAAIKAGQKFFLSTTDPYDVGNVVDIADKLNGPTVKIDTEVAPGSGFFARANANAGNDFTVYKKTQILKGSAEEVAIAATVNVDAEGNVAGGNVEEFRHKAQKTEGQTVGTATGVNDGDVVVGDLIKTVNGIRYFAATTAAQGAKFKIYTDEKIVRADTAALVLADNGIERATAETTVAGAADLKTAEDRINETKWANIIEDVTAAKANLTFNRAKAAVASDTATAAAAAGNATAAEATEVAAAATRFIFFRDLVHHEKVVGNNGQVYYALNANGLNGNIPEGTDLQLLKDANDTTPLQPPGVRLDPAGLNDAGKPPVAVVAGDAAGQRNDVLALFQEGAIDKTNGAGGDANGTGDHIIYKRSKVNTIRKSIKEIKKFGKEKMTKIRSFEGASNLTILGGPNPPSFNRNLKDAFKGAANLATVDNIKDWNTRNVTNMEGMFKDAANFNLDVKFDTKNVTKMNNMFKGASAFNRAVDFNTEKVTNMKGMFEGAVEFNQPINFNTKNVEDVDNMFNGAAKFDQDLDDLDFRNVTTKANIDKDTKATGVKKGPPAVGQRKARLSGNVVALEKGDKLFVEMVKGTYSLGYVDNAFKANFNDTNDGVYAGFTPGDNHVAVITAAVDANAKTRATLTVGGITATIFGIEVRHRSANPTGNAVTQPLLNPHNLYVYLNKNLGNLGMTLREGGNEVAIAAAAAVAAAAAGAKGATAEQILARDGFAIAGGKFVKPAGFTVYKFARPGGDNEAKFDAILGGAGGNKGERTIVFN